MSDGSLRRLERGQDPSDWEQLVSVRLRTGALAPERVAVAAFLRGEPIAGVEPIQAQLESQEEDSPAAVLRTALSTGNLKRALLVELSCDYAEHALAQVEHRVERPAHLLRAIQRIRLCALGEDSEEKALAALEDAFEAREEGTVCASQCLGSVVYAGEALAKPSPGESAAEAANQASLAIGNQAGGYTSHELEEQERAWQTRHTIRVLLGVEVPLPSPPREGFLRRIFRSFRG